MFNLYVIRHGQSETNLSGVYCGWKQTSLTEKGFNDARNAGKVLAGIPFEKIYVSDLKRAIQTCETALPGCTYEIDPLLREISVGTLVDMLPAEAQEKFGEPHRLARVYRDFSAYDGESHEMHYARIAQFMHKMEQSGHEGNVAVFCHEGTVRCMLDYVLGMAFSRKGAIVDNGSVSVLCWNGQRWLLKKWNIT